MMVVYGVLLMSALALGLAITGLLTVYRSSKPLFVAAILLLVGRPSGGVRRCYECLNASGCASCTRGGQHPP